MANKTRRDPVQEMNDRITELSKNCDVKGWSEFAQAINLPADFMPAVASGRVELLSMVKPRPLTAEESEAVICALVVLVKTNMALSEHAQELAKLVGNWSAAFKQLHNVGERIEHFANFRRMETEESDEP